MTDKEPQRSGSYVPSPPAAFVAVLLSIGIIVLAIRDSFTVDYDARQTIVIFAVLIGGTLGFDFRRGRWQEEDRKKFEPPAPPAETEDPA